MDNKLITLIMTLVVGIILTGSLLAVAISDATKTEATFDNDGYFHMEKYGTDEDVTIVWDQSDPKQITVNGETYAPNTPINQFVNLAIGDDWYFRYADGGSNTYIQVSYGGNEFVASNNTSTDIVTVTCSNGTATIAKGSETVQTATYTELYVISGDEGEYVMKNATESVTVAGDTEFIGLGTTNLGTGRATLKVTGNVDEGAEVVVIGSTPTGATVSDIEVNATPLTKYVGFELTIITFVISVDDTDYPATYSYFIVPSEITLELANHLNAEQIALVSAIPILVIVALLMVAVNALRRND